MNNRIEQLITEIENYIDNCKYQPLSQNKIIVNKDQMEDMLAELRLRTPDEIKKYQKIINNRDNIISEAKQQADQILNEAQIRTDELINEHEIMQRAYAQANKLIDKASAQAQEILDSATAEANEIRMSAVAYTDDMLAKLQYIIEHSIRDNKEKYNSLLNGLENELSIVQNNRKELQGEEAEDVKTDTGANNSTASAVEASDADVSIRSDKSIDDRIADDTSMSK